MDIKAQKIGSDGASYRLVDDLPMWGGYYSIEKLITYGACDYWLKVYPEADACDTDYYRTLAEFDRL